jgi:hypothetical protein
MSKRVMVFVGTTKGGFIFESDEKRKKWQMSDIQFKGWNVMHMQLDPRDNRLHAATSHFVYGPTTHHSDDLGKTWTQAKQAPALMRPSKSGRPAGTVDEAFRSEGGESIEDKPEKMNKVWNIRPGRREEPNVLYAGAQPASLFISRDRGETWELNEALVRSSPTRTMESRRGWLVPAYDPVGPDGPEPHVHRGLGGRLLPHRRWRQDLGALQQERARRFHAEHFPGVRSVRA